MPEQKPVNFDVFGVNVRLEFGESAPSGIDEVTREIWSAALAEEGPGEATVSIAHTDSDEYLESLSSQVTLAALEARAGQMMLFHAAGIAADDGRVLAFVGPSGRGKTTLSRALAKHYGYVSDETIAVGFDLTVYPYRKPLSVKRPGKPKVQLSPVADGLLPLPDARLRLAKLVILDRREDVVEPYIEAVTLLDAFQTLVPETSYLVRMQTPLQRFAQICEATGGVLRVVYSEAETLVDLVPRLYEWPSEAVQWQPAMAAGVEASASGQAAAEYTVDNVVDAIEAEGSVVLLSSDGMLRVLAGVGPTIWQAVTRGLTVAQASDEVVALHGVPPKGRASEIVGTMFEELCRAGLLRAGRE